MTARASGLGWPESTTPSATGARREGLGLGWPSPPPGRVEEAPVEPPTPHPAPVEEALVVVPAGRTPTPIEGVLDLTGRAERALVPARAPVEEVTPRRQERSESTPADVGSLRSPAPTPVGGERQDSARLPWPRPAATRVLAVANQKGGVGKTTSAVNLAAALASAGAHVLVLDLDPQGNASTALGVEHTSGVPSVYEALIEGRPLREVVSPVAGIDRLDCAPATIDLAGAEIELVPMVARETRMQRALAAYVRDRDAAGRERLDYVFIDCPPSLGLLTVNALVAAREVLIPIQCEYYALEGLGQLLRNVELVQAHLNPDLVVSTILLTMYDARTRLAAQVADEVRDHFPAAVLRASIPRSVRISEAPSYGQTVITYDPGSTGALSYEEAARELARRGTDLQEESKT